MQSTKTSLDFRRPLLILLIGILIVLTIGTSEATVQKPVKTINFVSASNDYPISYVEPSGQPKGLLIDVLKAFCKDYGYTLKIDMRPSSEVLATFKSQKADLMYNAGMIDGSSDMVTSMPFYFKNYVLFTDGSYLKSLKGTKNFHDLVDFIENATDTIGMHQNSTTMRESKKHFPDLSFKTFDNEHALIESIHPDQISFALVPRETGLKLISDLNLPNVKLVDQSIFIEDCFIFGSTENSATIDAFNKYLTLIKNNGTLKSLTYDYFDVEKVDWRNNAGIFGLNLIIAVCVLAALIIAGRALFLEKVLERKSAELLDEVDKQKELTKKLLDEEQAKNTIFINTSHELRTPISAILNAAQLTERLLEKNDVQELHRISKFNQIVENNSYRLLRVINNIIDVNRMDNHQMELYPDIIDVVFFFEELQQHVREHLEYFDFEMGLTSTEEELYLQVDPQALERIMVNLISNSIKFSRQAVSIQIDIRSIKAKQVVEIEYRDNSLGIEPGNEHKLFEKFNTLENKLSKPEGHGLGLFISKQLVELHQGTITYAANQPTGMVYTVQLPVKLSSSPHLKPPQMSTVFDRMQYIRMELSELSRKSL